MGVVLALDVGDSFRSIFDYEFVSGPESGGPPSTQPVNPLLPAAATANQNVFGLGNFMLESSTFVYQFLDDNVRARIQLLYAENRLDIVSTPPATITSSSPSMICCAA